MSGEQSEEEEVTLSPADYGVLAFTLAVSVGIGIFFALRRGGQRSQKDYLLAGGNMAFWPVCLSLFATFQSAVGLLGVPADVYVYGSMIIYQGIGVALGNLVTAFTLVPLFHPLRLTSVYQYLQLRFDSVFLRYVGVVVGMAWTTLYMGIALLSPALAIQAVTNIPLVFSVVGVAAVGTAYTTVGGMKSVIWTDVFQSIVMLVGLAAVIIKGIVEVGGVEEAVRICQEGGRIVLDDVSADPRVRHTIWGLLIGYGWYWISVNTNQSSVQRISSCRSQREARLVFLSALPLNVVYGLLLAGCGLVIYAYYTHTGCDPLRAGHVSNSNQLIIHFVVKVFGFLPGLSGLYLATILSGSLSTLSSGLNSMAANTVEDILKRPLSKLDSRHVTTVTKCIVVLYGCVITGIAYLMRSLQGPVSQIATSVSGACGGPLYGLYVLAAVFPQANRVGAIVGFFVGLGVSLWVSIGGFLHGTPLVKKPPGPLYACVDTNVTSWANSSSGISNETYYSVPTTVAYSVSNVTEDESRSGGIYDVSYLWYSSIGSLVAIVIGLIVSTLYNCFNPQPHPPPQLLIPQVRRFVRQGGKDGDHNNSLQLHQHHDDLSDDHNIPSPQHHPHIGDTVCHNDSL